MSAYDLAQWIEVTYSESERKHMGYERTVRQSMDGYYGFKNKATWKVCKLLDNTNEYGIDSTLCGIHFNSKNEMAEYITKFKLLPDFDESEYAFINWSEVWEQMGHSTEYGLLAEVGETGSWLSSYKQEHPEYDEADLKDKMRDEAEYIQVGYINKDAIKLSNEITKIKGLLARIHTLKRCTQAKEALLANIEDLKAVTKRIYSTYHKFPVTGEALVDTFFAQCKVVTA